MSAPRARDASVVAAIVQRIDPTDPVALTNAAWFAARRGAVSLAHACVARAIDLPAARRSLRQLESGHPERLLLALPAALTGSVPRHDVADAPPPAGDQVARGRALLEAGRVADSLAVFDACLMNRRADPVALFHRGVALAKLRRYGDALADWSAIECADPAGALGTVSRRHAQSARRLADLFAGSD